MRVLVVGSGGREHALAWKLAQSPQVTQLFVAPGNGGTETIAHNVPIDVQDISALVDLAQREQIDLTVVGPEAPLVAGLVDALAAVGLRAFGPSAAAARLEGSKVFAKRFMIEEGIPTGVGSVFCDYEAALAYLRQQSVAEGRGRGLVVKASGLAAGKGVIVCSTLHEAEDALHQIMVERAFGSAGDKVLIEDRLVGEEASLLALCDGQTVIPLLPARDYKPVGDGDQGPNTGGMGCYAPSAHVPPEMVQEVVSRVLQPAVDGMRRRGMPYSGLLYAGLMLTEEGPRVLEFNCRFGDPETQVLLPLLDTDIVDLFLACIEGRLHKMAVRWKPAHAVTVVMASGGYPGSYEKGREIRGVPEDNGAEDVVVFQAGTQRCDGRLVTAGGRVLAVTATASSQDQAREKAYAAIKHMHFEEAYFRTDIALEPSSPPQVSRSAKQGAYALAGVDIEAGNRAVELIRDAVQSTHTSAVLSDIGLFGGLFALKEALQAKDPVLVASTDSVGTKTMIAAAMQRYDTIGQDLVNHCANDILVQGARPLFFLDYFASGYLNPEHVADVVGGCALACRDLDCALIGGETAELPGVYQSDQFDLVGAIVGWVEREAIIDGRNVRPDDICLGLPSSGLHTNGYSLARRVLGDMGWDTWLPELDRTLGEALLTPHRAYVTDVEALWASGVVIKAMAHITGGGFVDNIPRVLPWGVGVEIDRASWQVPPIFSLIQMRGDVADKEMVRVFNMGIGLVLVVAPEQVQLVLDTLPEAVVLGRTVPWEGAGERVRI